MTDCHQYRFVIDPVTQPHPLLEAFGRPTWRELRAPEEARQLRKNPVPLAGGDGQRVVAVPGFLGSDDSVAPLASWLAAGEYDTSVVPLERNVRGSGWAVDRIVDEIDASSKPTILIGHSRGGQQARVAAVRRPDRIQHLVTLGAPLRHVVPRHFALRSAVESLRFASRLGVYRPVDLDDEAEYSADLFAPYALDAPWTSIWSRSDGFVAWQSCTDPAADSIEIDCSHRGLIESVAAFSAIAAVLQSVTPS